jgi:F-type H+-transporting ATPase subunit alpha
MLKQDERDPRPVEEQVVVIFAATNGYLDEVETDDVPDWERQFRDFMRDSHDEILSTIRDEQQISDKTTDSLREAIEHFNENYEPESRGLVAAGVEAEQEGGTQGGATGDDPTGDQLNAAGERS